jgi:hypothetical protein
MAGAAHGFAGMGPYAGGQAEMLRVPYADFNCLKLPEDANEKETDFVMLSDIFPTGWHGTRLTSESKALGVDRDLSCQPCRLNGGSIGSHPGSEPDLHRRWSADRLALAEQLGASRTALGENDHCQAPSLIRRCLRATLRAGRGAIMRAPRSHSTHQPDDQ